MFTSVRNLSPKLVVLVCLFAAGSWLAVNGIWVELPILVAASPQQWSLPSYLTIAIQVANVGPILYMLGNKYVTFRSRQIITEVPVIYVILAIGIIASFLLSFLWKETSIVAGIEYSTYLIALTFFLAIIDCTSSVTFIPFMASIPSQYMIVFFVGQGLSGFLPSIAALIQGVGNTAYLCENKLHLQNVSKNFLINGSYNTLNVEKNVSVIVPKYIKTSANFSARDFFLFITVITISSLVSFIALDRIGSNNRKKPRDEFDLHNYDSKEDLNNSVIANPMSSKTNVLLLISNSLICGIGNGVLPALQSYACIPYGQNIYHLTLTLSAVANPLACFFYFFVAVRSTKNLVIGVFVYLISAAYTIGMAASSPCPLLNNNPTGGPIIIIITVFGHGLVSYLKTAISSLMREEGHRALQWYGATMQLGSLLGALIIFPLVNVYDTFKQSQPCQQC